MTKKYDVEFKKQLVHAYIQGKSYPQLEKEYGVSKSTISGWVKNTAKNANILLNHNQIILMPKRSMILIKKLLNWKRRTFKKKAAAFFAKELE